MFRPHRAIFRQHILIEPTALFSLMSIARRHYCQFWYFENVCSSSVLVLRLLCAPAGVYIVLIWLSYSRINIFPGGVCTTVYLRRFKNILNDILVELNVSLESSKIKSVLHYVRKRRHDS
jgi:hypothetical protein